MNTYAKLATLAALRRSIVEHANPTPTRGLAARAAELAADDQFGAFVYSMATGRHLRAAILWGRIGALLAGQPRVDALALGAVFAHKSRNVHLTVNYVLQLQDLARTDGFEIPPIVEILKRNHTVREALVRAHP